MIIEGNFIILLPIESAWDFLMDIESVARCMPGLKQVEAIDDKTYRCTIEAKVAYLKFNFSGDFSITKDELPVRVESVVKGEDRKFFSTLKAENLMELEAISEDVTMVNYKIDVNLFGRLGTFGQRIIRGKAEQIAQEFINNVQSMIK
ncbi:MAG: CoxG family protein [Planctomycetota bacterium]|jgi:carbon monoxide dehydrogenase subunit G